MKQKNTKELDFDNTMKKVEGISNKVDVIMRNRLIIAFFLIVDGVAFILNPNTTLSGMAKKHHFVDNFCRRLGFNREFSR